VAKPSPPVTFGKFSPEQSGALGMGGKPPSGMQRPQLMSQYSANHASPQAAASVAHISHVASGHSSVGGGSTSSQTSGSGGGGT
jgi:hypothetical protein